MTAAAGDGPDPHVLATMRRIGIAMFAVGAVTAMSVVFTAEETPAGRFAQTAVAVGYVVCALGLSVSRSRLWPVQATLATSIVLLSVGTATSRPIGLGPLFYLWPLVYAAYFFTPRQVVLSFLLMVSSLAMALILNASATARSDTLIRTSISVGGIAALILFMRLREGRLRDELALLAETDPLTGLLNRRALDPRLRRLTDEAVRDGAPLSIAVIDVDHFKTINDDHGHIAGDEALKRITNVLLALASQGDPVARLGGDEFVVALPGRDLREARAWANQIVGDLRGEASAAGIAITVSVGLAGLDDHAQTPDAMLRRADAAVYAAKAADGARAAWWDGTMQTDPPPDAPLPPLQRAAPRAPDDRRIPIAAAASGTPLLSGSSEPDTQVELGGWSAPAELGDRSSTR
jgi:diguanylate cyclase (GGDEF)-like protein